MKIEIEKREIDTIVEDVGSIRETINRLAMSDRRYFRMAQTIQGLFDKVKDIQGRKTWQTSPTRSSLPS